MPKISKDSNETSWEEPPEGLISRWFPAGADVIPLATRGFSGSLLCLVRPGGHGLHVLKSFSDGTDRCRAEWVHQIACHLRASAVRDLFPPLATSVDGGTLVATGDGRFWEMTAYVEGVAVPQPTPRQVVAGMQAIAHVHGALALAPGEAPRPLHSRGLAARLDCARRLLERPWKDFLASARWASKETGSIGAALTRACEAFDTHDGTAILQRIAACSPTPLVCQVVLRDIWSDHVLFGRHERDRVVGIVDLHAVGIDTPATDVARLLGSWIPSDERRAEAWWKSGIDAYEAVRQLGDHERRLVPILAATGIVFGLDNWWRWTLVERRRFVDAPKVVARINRLTACLPVALRALDRTV